jgi:2-haloacid dehalogenase
MNDRREPPTALVFDVFGTVVDWRSTVVREGQALAAEQGVEVDWPAFADRWRREGYLEPIGRVVRGEEPVTPIDQVLREHLGRLAGELGFAGVGAQAIDRFSGVWDRLDPWPDARPGLERLAGRYTVSPLSNGTFAGLTRMGRHGHLPWSCIISTELFGTYKPDPRTYLGAARLLGLEPGQVMMVAAHPPDLRAAARQGLRTAFVPRPEEWGPGTSVGTPDEGTDLVAADFLALADALDA